MTYAILTALWLIGTAFSLGVWDRWHGIGGWPDSVVALIAWPLILATIAGNVLGRFLSKWR